MNTVKSTLLVLLLTRYAPAQGVLSRQQAVQQALAQLSPYSQSVGNVTLSEMEVQVAEAARKPKFETAISVTGTTPSLNDYAGNPYSFITANGLLHSTALLRLRGELDTSGALAEEVARTDALRQAAAAGSLIARQNLVLATEQAFYALALAQARVGGSRMNLATAGELEKVTGVLFKAGDLPGVDLERARLAVHDRQIELDTNLATEASARESLRTLLGVAPAAPLQIEPLPEVQPAPAELQSFQPELTAGRPELAQAEAQIEAAQHEAEVARRTLAPHLTYSIGMGMDAGSLTPPGMASGLGLQAQLALLIPFDDGGVADARARQAQARQQQYEAARSLARRLIDQQFASARALAEKATLRIQLGQQNLSRANHIHYLAVARYRAGEARIIEVTDALNNIALERLNWLQAQADYQQALAQLRYAAAMDLSEGNK